MISIIPNKVHQNRYVYTPRHRYCISQNQKYNEMFFQCLFKKVLENQNQ